MMRAPDVLFRAQLSTSFWRALVALGILFYAQSSVFAQAGVPSATNSSAPGLIYLVGSDNIETDPLGQFNVVVRDNTGATLANVNVSLDFDAMFDGGNLADNDQGIVFNGQLYPGMTHDCLHNIISARTDGSGVARFRIMGLSNNDGLCRAGNGAQSMIVRAGSVVLRHTTVAIPDQDGNGVGINDLSLILADLGCGQYFARSDLDGSGTLGINDMSVWLSIYGSLKSANNASPANACF